MGEATSKIIYVIKMFSMAIEETVVMLTEKTPLTPFNEILPNPIEKEFADVLTPENSAIEVNVFCVGVQSGILNLKVIVFEFLEAK
jgi:hypothetical protein